MRQIANKAQQSQAPESSRQDGPYVAGDAGAAVGRRSERVSAVQLDVGEAQAVRLVAPVEGDAPASRSGSMVIRQRTLKNRIKCSGVGLHSGRRVNMVLHPAEVDSGITFLRTDAAGGEALIAARADKAVDLVMCTNVANEAGVRVGTIEHLMAAFAGCGIDNVLVELDGPEVPVMDGSSAPFVFLIECADSVEQAAPRKFIEILKRVEVRDGDRMAAIEPGDGFSVSFGIDFAHTLVGAQRCDFDLADGVFKAEISRARTFGFEGEVEKLRSLGLALGGSLDNAVVLGGDGILNEGGLRYADEFVRHKALDAIGDLYLAGAPLLGHFQGERSGHAMNNLLLRTLLADRGAWRYCVRAAAPAEAVSEGWQAADGIAAVAVA